MAVCKDGNNQMLQLAWGIVEVENTFTWKCFIKIVRHNLELGDDTELTTITAMQKVFLFSFSFIHLFSFPFIHLFYFSFIH